MTSTVIAKVVVAEEGDIGLKIYSSDTVNWYDNGSYVLTIRRGGGTIQTLTYNFESAPLETSERLMILNPDNLNFTVRRRDYTLTDHPLFSDFGPTNQSSLKSLDHYYEGMPFISIPWDRGRTDAGIYIDIIDLDQTPLFDRSLYASTASSFASVWSDLGVITTEIANDGVNPVRQTKSFTFGQPDTLGFNVTVDGKIEALRGEGADVGDKVELNVFNPNLHYVTVSVDQTVNGVTFDSFGTGSVIQNINNGLGDRFVLEKFYRAYTVRVYPRLA